MPAGPQQPHRVRVTLYLDPDLWHQIRVTAYKGGTTASRLIESTMRERLRVRLPDLDDQGAPVPRDVHKGKPRTPAHTMSTAALANWAVSREAEASVALDHDPHEGTQSLGPEQETGIPGVSYQVPVDQDTGEIHKPLTMDDIKGMAGKVPPNQLRAAAARIASSPAATGTSETRTTVAGRTSASTTGMRSFGSSRPAPKPGTKPAPKGK